MDRAVFCKQLGMKVYLCNISRRFVEGRKTAIFKKYHGNFREKTHLLQFQIFV